jgi:hypothetical protein
MFCTEHLYIKNSEKALGDFMIGVWLGISVFSSIVLLAISIVTILLYGKQPESRKKINMFRVLGFMLVVFIGDNYLYPNACDVCRWCYYRKIGW